MTERKVTFIRLAHVGYKIRAITAIIGLVSIRGITFPIARFMLWIRLSVGVENGPC